MTFKKGLKDWESEFEQKNGRAANNDDKMTLGDRYLAYKTVL
jgi:hypothetical protein